MRKNMHLWEFLIVEKCSTYCYLPLYIHISDGEYLLKDEISQVDSPELAVSCALNNGESQK